MTGDAVLSLVRQFSRIDATGVSDTNALLVINQAHIQVCRDIGGIPKKAWVQIAAYFDISTDMYFRMTIDGTGDTLTATNIQVSATEQLGKTGTEVKTLLQTAIRAATGGTGTTVTWNSYYFTITTTGATSQKIEPPTLATQSDATVYLFGGYQQTQTTSTTWTGGTPPECLVEADLPSDFHQIQKVNWNQVDLKPAPRDYFVRPLATGTPSYYGIRNDHLYLYPAPSSQDLCYIEYMSTPAATTITNSTTSSPVLPDRYHMLLVYLAASMMLNMTFEYEKAAQLYAQYWREKNKYIVARGNEQTNSGVEPAPSVWYKVVV